MAIAADNFFHYVDDFFKYRREIYELSPQTLKSNRVDLTLFENFIESQDEKIINGPAVIDFQYYLKNQRENCGASINRKIFALRSYGNFLKLYDALNLLSAHKECHFFRVYFDCEADFQNSSSLIFSRLNISF